MWIRTCQECGHVQPDTRPIGEPTDAYCNRKCRKCRSMGLDYGKNDSPPDDADDGDDLA